MGAPAFVTLLRLCALAAPLAACGKADPPAPAPSSSAATTTAVAAKPTASVVPPDSCPGCDLARPSPAFVFEGQFMDARCTEPVAHATLPPCTTLRVTGAAPVTVVDAAARKPADQRTSHSVVRQLTRDEMGKLFAKQDGTCAPYEPRGWKLAPEQCDGKKVCRQDSGDLACVGCRTLTNGCPDYVETRAYVLLSK